MVTIWKEEKKHMKCIQDPQLEVDYIYTLSQDTYRRVGYNCQCIDVQEEQHLWSHSIFTWPGESVDFYDRLVKCFVRFIPGSSASDVYFQVYFLEGLARLEHWQLRSNSLACVCLI